MKKFKTILVWIAISLLVQCGVLLFLDQVYFKDDAKVNIEQVKIDDEIKNNQNHPYIPEEAIDIKPSYDGKYISYMDGTLFNILESNTGEIQNFDLIESGPVLHSLWLSDRNVLLTLENVNGRIALFSYDAKKKENTKIIDLIRYSPVYRNFNIKSSPITGVTYVEIGSAIFRIDINQSHAQSVPIAVRQVGSMEVIPTKDRLVYIAKGGTVIHMTQPNERKVMAGYEPLEIMAIDENDMLYMCSSNVNMITKIIKIDLDNINSKVEVINLGREVNKKDIFIKNTGEIFINDSIKNEVVELNSNKIYKYEGKFIGMYQRGIASKKDNKLYRVSF